MRSLDAKITPKSLLFFLLASALVIKSSIEKNLGAGPLRKALGVASPPGFEATSSLNQTTDPLEMLVGKSIRRAAKFVPGTHNCLSQALAGQALLMRLNRSSQIIIGFNPNTKRERFESHAWLLTPSGIVVGGEIAKDFKTVTVYSRPDSQGSSETRNLRTDLNNLLSLTKASLSLQLGLNAKSAKGSMVDFSTMTLAKHHRVSGLIADSELGRQSTFSTVSQHSQALRSEAMSGLRLVHETQQISKLFRDHRIPHLVFKGVALATLSNRNLTARGAGDVDVLIDYLDVPRAHRMLTSAGFRPKVAFEPKEGTMWKFWAFRDRELGYFKDRLILDLHWRIPKNESLTASTVSQLSRATVVSIAEVNVPTLSPGDALVAAAVHNYLDFCQNLRGVMDIVYLANLRNIRIEDDVPDSGKQLLADTLEFVRRLLGEEIIPSLPGIPAASEKRVRYLLKMWEKNAVLPLVQANVKFRGGELLGRFEHTVRYGFSFKEVARFFAKVMLDFPDYHAKGGSTSVFGALSYRFGQLVTGSIPHLRARRESINQRSESNG